MTDQEIYDAIDEAWHEETGDSVAPSSIRRFARNFLSRAIPERHVVVPGWQPIETAPRDGTQIIMFNAMDNVAVIGSWSKHNHVPVWGWIRPVEIYGEEVDGFIPTHWMPLPAAPAPEGEA